jgi:hypothetical protein
MQVRVAAEGRRDVAERIIEYSENGRINTKTHTCHVAADTSVSTCLKVQCRIREQCCLRQVQENVSCFHYKKKYRPKAT